MGWGDKAIWKHLLAAWIVTGICLLLGGMGLQVARAGIAWPQERAGRSEVTHRRNGAGSEQTSMHASSGQRDPDAAPPSQTRRAPTGTRAALAFLPRPASATGAPAFFAWGASGQLLFERDAIAWRPQAEHSTLVQTFLGVDDRVRLQGEARQAGVMNFFLGDDPTQWQTNVPIFGAVRYRSLYPGIDLVVDSVQDAHSGRRVLRRRFWIGPDADPGRIRWMLHSDDGRREMSSAGPRSRRDTPKAADWLASITVRAWRIGDDPRTPVPIEMTMDTQGQARFAIAAPASLLIEVTSPLDEDRPAAGGNSNVLTDTPASLVFSTYLGGDGATETRSMAVDANGNSFVVGYTRAGNFPTLNGYQPTAPDKCFLLSTGFVASFTISGTLRYATYLGGANTGHNCNDQANDVAVDEQGHVYVTGSTHSPDFPLVKPLFSEIDLGDCAAGDSCNMDAFIVELSPDGSNLLFSTYLGGAFDDAGYSVSWSESLGALLVTGKAESYDLPITANAYRNPGDTDGSGTGAGFFGLVSFVDPDPALVTLSHYGVPNSQNWEENPVNGITFGALQDADIYLTGSIKADGLPLKNPYQSTRSNVAVYVAHFTLEDIPGYTPTLQYATYLGGQNEDRPRDIAVDPSGNIYVVGSTSSSDFPRSSNAPDPLFAGTSEGFVTSLAVSGTLRYSTFLGGSGWDDVMAVAVDDWGYAYVTGGSSSADLPSADPADKIMDCGDVNGDAYIAKIDRHGQRVLYVSCLGVGYGSGVATDGRSGIYAAANTLPWAAFATTPGAFQSTAPPCPSGCTWHGAVSHVSTLPWTLIYYGDADHNLTDALQTQHSKLQDALDNPNMQVILLEDKNSSDPSYTAPDSAYYVLQPDSVPEVDGVNRFLKAELNTADANTLITFVRWARQWARTNRPSRHYALIMDDHGTGINGALADCANCSTLASDPPMMSVKEIGDALAAISDQGKDKFDVVYMLACLMGMIEDGYQWRDAADYYVASEAVHFSAPIEWSSLISVVNESTLPISYSVSLVDEYYRHRKRSGDPSTLSVVDLSQTASVQRTTYQLGDALAERIATVALTLTQILTDVQRFDMNIDGDILPDDDYIDLYDFALRVKLSIPDAAVQAKAQAVLDAVSAYVVHERHTSGRAGPAYWNHANAHGVSIFFPRRPRSFYNGGNFAFVGFTPWYPTGQEAGARAEVAGEGWGSLLKAYVAAVYPNRPDDPNPPPLVSRVWAPDASRQRALYIPIVVRQ